MLVAVTGCGSGGDDVPANAVAKVGDTAISVAVFNKRLRATVKSQTKGGKAITYVPPDFDRCVAVKEEQNAVPEGGEGTSKDGLRDECETEYEPLRTQVMEFLIQQAWVDQEAGEVGVSVTHAEVRKEFELEKHQRFSTEKAYEDFLVTSGRSESEIVAGVGTALRQQKLATKMTAGKVKVSDPEIEAYYAKYKKSLGQPARRSIRLVITPTEARADEAKHALDSGQGWDTVAKEYSIDKATAANGGLLQTARGTGDPAIDAVLRKVHVGTVSDPIKSQYGWSVLEVEKVMPPSHPSLKDVRAQITSTLKQQHRQEALDQFAASFRERYRSKTVCADDYKVASCGNGPETNPTAPSKVMTQPESPQSN
jgi:parvulin-like peptidyl-prolyl isomerase